MCSISRTIRNRRRRRSEGARRTLVLLQESSSTCETATRRKEAPRAGVASTNARLTNKARVKSLCQLRRSLPDFHVLLKRSAIPRFLSTLRWKRNSPAFSGAPPERRVWRNYSIRKDGATLFAEPALRFAGAPSIPTGRSRRCHKGLYNFSPSKYFLSKCCRRIRTATRFWQTARWGGRPANPASV